MYSQMQCALSMACNQNKVFREQRSRKCIYALRTQSCFGSHKTAIGAKFANNSSNGKVSECKILLSCQIHISRQQLHQTVQDYWHALQSHQCQGCSSPTILHFMLTLLKIGCFVYTFMGVLTATNTKLPCACVNIAPSRGDCKTYRGIMLHP